MVVCKLVLDSCLTVQNPGISVCGFVQVCLTYGRCEKVGMRGDVNKVFFSFHLLKMLIMLTNNRLTVYNNVRGFSACCKRFFYFQFFSIYLFLVFKDFYIFLFLFFILLDKYFYNYFIFIFFREMFTGLIANT